MRCFRSTHQGLKVSGREPLIGLAPLFGAQEVEGGEYPACVIGQLRSAEPLELGVSLWGAEARLGGRDGLPRSITGGLTLFSAGGQRGDLVLGEPQHLGMVEEGRDCRDIVTQLSAVSKAVDRAAFKVVAVNLKACVQGTNEGGPDEGELEKMFMSLV